MCVYSEVGGTGLIRSWMRPPALRAISGRSRAAVCVYYIQREANCLDTDHTVYQQTPPVGVGWLDSDHAVYQQAPPVGVGWLDSDHAVYQQAPVGVGWLDSDHAVY